MANTAWMPWIFMGLCGRTMGLARHPRSSPLHQGAAVADLTCRPVLLAALSSQHANACTGPSSRRCRTNGGLTYLTPVRNQRGRAAAQEIVQWLVASRNWTCTAADALVAKGERPTVERVRAHLDTGSPNTATRLLETLWEILGCQIHPESPGLKDAPAVLGKLAGQVRCALSMRDQRRQLPRNASHAPRPPKCSDWSISFSYRLQNWPGHEPPLFSDLSK